MEKARLMDLLHANRASGHPTLTDPDSGNMEAEATGETGTDAGHPNDTAEVCPHPAPGRDPPTAPSTPGNQQRQGPIEAGGAGARDAHTRRGLPLSALERTAAGTEEHHTDSHPHPTDGEVCRATEGDPERPTGHSEIPQSETALSRESGALDVANIHASGRSTSPVVDIARFDSMGTPGHVDEASHVAPEQAGDAPTITHGEGGREEPRQTPGQVEDSDLIAPTGTPTPSRQDLLRGLASLQLTNDSNWCFVNAAVMTTLWAYLSMRTFTLDQWGPQATEIAQMLLNHDSRPVELSTIPCFQPMFAQWHDLGRQGDPVEFLAHFIRGMQFTCINMSWEKRIQIGMLTETTDESDSFTPLILRFDPALMQDDSITLLQMLRDWSNQDGMMTALLHPTPILCVQIDRHVRSGDGSVIKCDIPVNFHWGLEVPIYAGDGLDTAWHDYKVIAAIAHLGHDTAGHCRALMKVQMNADTSHPYMFLLTDDWQKAVPVWKEPSWFLRNISCFWLGRCDQISLHDLRPDLNQFMLRPPEPTRMLQASDLLSHFVEGTDENAMPD